MAEPGMFVEERKARILELIESQRKVTVPTLCDAFRVSSATIRNDLRDLERAGLLIRTHGGAMVKSKTGMEQDMTQRGVQHLAEKRRIAEAALGLVEDGDTIILDTGSTTFELALLLGRRKDITVVTNDLAIALVLEDWPSVRVVFMGGIVRRKYHCTVIYGSAGRDILAGLSVDKAFMASNSFSLDKGASTPDINHAETKKLMMSIAAKIVLLFDASKFGRSSFALFAPLPSIDAIVTDSIGASERARSRRSALTSSWRNDETPRITRAAGCIIPARPGGTPMAEQFKIGDVVRLKSGGPSMTVESIESTGSAFCVWFDESDQGSAVRVHAFNPAVLTMGQGQDGGHEPGAASGG